MSRLLLAVLFFAVLRDSFAEMPHVQTVPTVPAFSVETLYDPEQKFSYVLSPTPTMRWCTNADGKAILLIDRGGKWKEVSLDDGTERDSATVQLYRSLLQGTDAIPDKNLDRVIKTLLAGTEPTAPSSLIKLDDAIGICGLNRRFQWIARTAKAWREVSLSPDTQQVAYVEGNDLYVMQLGSGRVTRITDDGSPTILNGILDWVYQEELYGRGNFRGYWWNADSTAIAYLKLKTADVPEFVVTDSSTVGGETLVERYPKAGAPIPATELWLAKLQSQTGEIVATIKPILKDSLPQDTLITRVGWHPHNGQVLVQTANRVQSESLLQAIDGESPQNTTVIVREHSDKWLEVQELPEILKSGDYLRLSDLPSGRRRLWRISADGSNRFPLTPSDFDVREIAMVSPDEQYALVTGDRLRGTVGQQLYRVPLNSAQTPIRLTDQTAWHHVLISEDGNWMVDHASSLTQPTTSYLRSLQDPDTPAIVLNQERLQVPKSVVVPSWHSISIDSGLSLPAYIIRPVSNRETGTDAKVPVLIETYGGPLAPTVKDQWSSGRFMFHQMLAQQGIAVMVVDNRSSGGRGLLDSWSIHRRMGEVETKDTVAAAQWLAQQAWADPDRIAIRGWSFGGFLTLHAMTHSKMFAAGVAGGSVTDWRNYDAIYTERYMGLPAENKAGYDATSPRLAAKNLHGRVLMLHGEVDDNVHLANTLQMAGELQRAGKTFDMMIYPGAAHSVSAAGQYYHMMKTTVEFLHRELKPTSIETSDVTTD